MQRNRVAKITDLLAAYRTFRTVDGRRLTPADVCDDSLGTTPDGEPLAAYYRSALADAAGLVGKRVPSATTWGMFVEYVVKEAGGYRP